MNLIDDVFQLVSELLRKNPYQDEVSCNVAMEDCYPMTDEDLVYSFPETPQYLASIGLLAIMAPDGFFRERNYSKGEKARQLDRLFMALPFPGVKKNVKGLMAVSFNMGNVKEWYKSELVRRFAQVPEHSSKTRKGWGWQDKRKGQYQFGVGRVFAQTGMIRKKVFIELMDLWEKNPQGVSIQQLSAKLNISTRRLRIEIDAINRRLSQTVGLEFRGDGSGTYELVESSSVSG